MRSKISKAILLLILLVSGVFIFIHYLVNKDFDSLILTPVYVFIVCLIYIALQVVKRYLFKEQHWWDWLYYIGLLAVVLPVLTGTLENLETMHLVASIGSVFFVLPVLLDVYQLTKKS